MQKYWLLTRTLIGIEWSWVLLAWSVASEDWEVPASLRIGAAGLLCLLSLETWWLHVDGGSLRIITTALWRPARVCSSTTLDTVCRVALRTTLLTNQVACRVGENPGSAFILCCKTRFEARRAQSLLASTLATVAQPVQADSYWSAVASGASVIETRTRAQALLTACAWLLICLLLAVRGPWLGVGAALLGIGAWRDVASTWLSHAWHRKRMLSYGGEQREGPR
jgi:hypothetical protein